MPMHVVDTLERLTPLMDAYAWPLTVVVLALVFGKQVRGLLNRLRTVSGPNFRADFDAKLRSAAQQVDLIHADFPQAVRSRYESVAQEAREAVEPDADSPSHAMMRAWERLEKAVRAVAESGSLSIPEQHRRSVERLVVEMMRRQRLTPATLDAFRDLQAARNSVVHGNLVPGEDDAERFLELVSELIASFELLAESPERPWQEVRK